MKFGDYCSFDYGRNYGVVYDALAWTDMLLEFGSELAYTDNFMVGRTTGVATYRNSNFSGLVVDGLCFALQYQGKNDRDEMRRANAMAKADLSSMKHPSVLASSAAMPPPIAPTFSNPRPTVTAIALSNGPPP